MTYKIKCRICGEIFNKHLQYKTHFNHTHADDAGRNNYIYLYEYITDGGETQT